MARYMVQETGSALILDDVFGENYWKVLGTIDPDLSPREMVKLRLREIVRRADVRGTVYFSGGESLPPISSGRRRS